VTGEFLSSPGKKKVRPKLVEVDLTADRGTTQRRSPEKRINSVLKRTLSGKKEEKRSETKKSSGLERRSKSY